MDVTNTPTLADGTSFHVVVDSPRGAHVRLTYEARWQAMSISRPLALGLSYPCDWGFIPSTPGPDGDLSRIRDELALFLIVTTAPEAKNPTVPGWDGPEAALAWLPQLAQPVAK